MSISWVQPGQLIIDNSFSPPGADQLAAAKALGVAAEMRYTSEPTSNPKNLTGARAAMLHSLGLGALANQEQTHLDSYEGEAGGRRRARVHATLLDAIGYPRDAPAVISHDTGLHAQSMPFMYGFDDEMRRVYGWHRTGGYIFSPEGIEQLRQAGICGDFLWQAYAGSVVTRAAFDPDTAVQLAAQAAAARWGAFADTELGEPEQTTTTNGRTAWRVTAIGTHRQAHAFQRLGYHVLADGPFPPGQVDENIVLRPVAVWLPGGNPTPTPGDDVSYALASVKLPNGATALARFRATVDATGVVRDLVWLTADKAGRCTDPAREITLTECLTATVDQVPAGDSVFVGFAGRDWSGYDFLNDGATGAVGAPGVPGPAGPQGAKGDPGRDGADGPTVTAVVDEVARRLVNG